MHLSEQEFWSLTPAKYFALYDRWEARLDHEDLMLAQICSTLVNVMRGKKGKPAKAQDFMRVRRKEPTKKQKQRQTVAEQIAIAKAITIAFGGVVLDKKRA